MPNELRVGSKEMQQALLFDGNGTVIRSQDDDVDAEALAAVMALAINAFVQAGHILNLGRLEALTCQAAAHTTVVKAGGGNLACLVLDGKQQPADAERALGASGWTGERPSQSQLGRTREAQIVDSSWADVAILVSNASKNSGVLRRALSLGDLATAETTAATLAAEGDPAAPAATMMGLFDGIGAVQSGDKSGGAGKLLSLGAAEANPFVKWVAHLWAARATIDAHDIMSARHALDQCQQLVSQLGSREKSLTGCVEALLLFATGQPEAALSELADARSVLVDVRDGPELAESWMIQAYALSHLGRDEESATAADRAHESSRTWWAPMLFSARRAIVAGNVVEARRFLNLLEHHQPRPPSLDRERRALEAVASGKVAAEVVARLYVLHDAAPSEETVSELAALVKRHPGFVQLRDTFAWKLFRAGKLEEAAEQFHTLSSGSLASDEVSSVLLGLGCLANARSKNTEPAARIHATVAEVSKTIKPPKAGSEIPRPAPVRKASQPAMAPAALPAAFTGEIGMFGLPELLEFLRSGRRTGTLTCSFSGGIGAICLSGGMISAAASPNSPSLGSLLVKAGEVTEDQIREAIVAQGGDIAAPLLGSVLVERGQATPDAVRRALVEQVYCCLRELIGWTEGQFAFDPNTDYSTPSVVALTIDPQAAMLDIFRRLDEEAIELEPLEEE